MERSEDDFIVDSHSVFELSKGERYLFEYLLYYCQKYATQTVVNTKEFRESYLLALAKNKVVQKESSVNKYFENLKNKGYLNTHPDYKKKYYTVKNTFLDGERRL